MMNPKVDANKDVLIFEHSHLLTNFLIKMWSELAHAAIAERNIFNVALPGGRTPVEFYCKLSALEDYNLWHKTHLFLGDERFVPADDPQSNLRLIKTNLLDYINIPEGNVHAVATNQETVAAAAEEYKNVMMTHFAYQKKRYPEFDLVILGIGEDGHTASLFPGMEHINDERIVTVPVSLPHLKNERVSITLPVINRAKNIVFLVTGPQKAMIMKKILEEGFDCPAAQVRPIDGKLAYCLDKEAAQQLAYRKTHTSRLDAISYNTDQN